MSLEKYIGKKINEWINYNNKDYKNMLKDCDLESSWNKLKIDFVNNELDFLEGYKDMKIRDIYWQRLYDKEIGVDAKNRRRFMKNWEFNELFCVVKETYYEFIEEKRGYRHTIARLMDEFYNLGEVEDIIVYTAIGELIVQQEGAFIKQCNIVRKCIENVDKSILVNELTEDEISILYEKIKVVLNKMEKIKKFDD